MKDLLPRDHLVHRHIINTARAIGSLYGYEEVSTPILEYTKVFDRTLGDTSDVVSKEMYSFLDKSNDSVALRPEFTAGIMRAFISNGLQQDLPLKYFSAGPLFRYDRPQAGRQRQFHQFNFENIGSGTPYSDAETIKLASHILAKLGILEDITLEINSLGCYESRKNYEQALTGYFRKHFDELSEDSKKRLEKKPLRIFDSKNEADKLISVEAPLIEDFYTNEAANYFAEVKKYLDHLEVKYVVNPRLVRGFDYYCHTAFEFTTTKLGAQGTVLGGGRYDGLAKLMGGPDTPAIGFAAGIERIAMMRGYAPEAPRSVYIIPVSSECTDYAIDLTNKLRMQNIHTILDLQGKVPKRLQRAVEKNAKFAVFIGSEEMASGKFKLKDLDSKTESELPLEQLIKAVTDLK
jgi:histidyl-tRNA synthetase